MKANLIKTLPVLASFLLLGFQLRSQNIWLNETDSYLSFEFARPSLDGPDLAFLSAVYDLTYVQQIGSNGSQVVLDLPMAYFNFEEGDVEDKFGIGNIYLGIRPSFNDKLMGEFGLTVPSAGDGEYNLMGLFGAFDRYERYLPDTWGPSAKLIFRNQPLGEGVNFRLKGGLTYLFSEDFGDDLNFFYLDYAGQIDYRNGDGVGVFAGLNGRTALNDDSKLTDESTQFLIGIGANYRANNVQPGLMINFPLNSEVKEFLSSILSVSLTYHFN